MWAGAIRSVSCAIPLVLAACSVSTPPDVRRLAPTLALPNEVSLGSGLPDGSKKSDIQRDFNKMLAGSLAKRGVNLRDGAGFALTTATAIASADMGITQSRGEAGQPIVWSETARKKGMFDSCRPQRLRVVVSGPEQKLAEGEVTACKITDAETSSLANLLAAKLTAR